MAISREKKKEIVAKVSDLAKKSDSIFFLDASLLKATDLNDFRKTVKGLGGSLQIVKKRLARRSFEAIGSLYASVFDRKGSIALASSASDEPSAMAKIIFKFSRKNEALRILGALLGGDFVPASGVVELAKLPPREVLLGQLVGTLSAPMRSMAIVLNAALKKFILTLDAVAKSRE